MRLWKSQKVIRLVICLNQAKSKIGRELKSFGINLFIHIWDANQRNIVSFSPSPPSIHLRTGNKWQKLCLKLSESKDFLLVFKLLLLFIVRFVDLRELMLPWINYLPKISQELLLIQEMVLLMYFQLPMVLLLEVVLNIFLWLVGTLLNLFWGCYKIEKNLCQVPML